MSHEEREQLREEMKQKIEEGKRPEIRKPGQMGGVPEGPRPERRGRGERASQRGPRAARTEHGP